MYQKRKNSEKPYGNTAIMKDGYNNTPPKVNKSLKTEVEEISSPEYENYSTKDAIMEQIPERKEFSQEEWDEFESKKTRKTTETSSKDLNSSESKRSKNKKDQGSSERNIESVEPKRARRNQNRAANVPHHQGHYKIITRQQMREAKSQGYVYEEDDIHSFEEKLAKEYQEENMQKEPSEEANKSSRQFNYDPKSSADVISNLIASIKEDANSKEMEENNDGLFNLDPAEGPVGDDFKKNIGRNLKAVKQRKDPKTNVSKEESGESDEEEQKTPSMECVKLANGSVMPSVDICDVNDFNSLPEPFKTDFICFCDITGFFDKEAAFRAMKLSLFQHKKILIKTDELSPEQLKSYATQRRELRKACIKKASVALERRRPGAFVVENSPIHGKGIFATMRIPDNTFLFSYEGELIGKSMSDKREKEYIKHGITSIYMFTISEDKIIDATKTGNNARYVNHSCSANCSSIECLDTHTIKYYSDRIIEAGEEITIDYISKDVIEQEKSCNCGSINCRFKRAGKK